VRESLPPMRYSSHVSLFSSIYYPSSFLEEDRCDTLMEDDVLVDSKTTMGTNLQMLGLVEFHREKIGVGENIFLIKREC
jgi:hypothetical protein